MRFNSLLTLVLLLAALLTVATSAHAVPITGGTGPGGVETTAGGGSALNLWLKGDAITGLSNNDPVSSWSNQATHGGAATAAGEVTSDQNPLFQSSVAGLNGNPAVLFDGLPSNTTGDMLSVTDVSMGNNASAYAVFQEAVQNTDNGSCCRPVFAGTSGLNGGGSAYSFNLADGDGATTNFYWIWPGQVDTIAGVAAQNGDHHFYSFTRDANTASGTVVYRDNTSIQVDTGTGNATDTTYNIGGDPQAAARHYAGNLAELVFFSRTLNDAERRIIDNHLSAKYNLGPTASGSNNTLGANDLYAGDLDTNGDYDRDVFGVGRVDASNLQTNTGAAGFGIEATSGLDDGDFVLAGHNVATNGLTSADVPVGEVSRWERVWYLDATDPGTDLASTFAFDFSEAGLNDPGLILSARLLYSSGQGPFSFSNLLSASSISGDLVTFNLPANLLLDGYYTLAFTAQPIPEPSSLLLLGLGVVGLAFQRRKRRTSP